MPPSLPPLLAIALLLLPTSTHAQAQANTLTKYTRTVNEDMQDGLCGTAGTRLQDVSHYLFELSNHTQCRETCSLIPDCTAYAFSTTPPEDRHVNSEANCLIYGQEFTFDKDIDLLIGEILGFFRGNNLFDNPLPITIAYPHYNPVIKYFCYIKRDCPDSDADSACDDEIPFYQERYVAQKTGYCLSDPMMHATDAFQVSKYAVQTEGLNIPLCRQACSAVPLCTAFDTHTTQSDNCYLHGQEFTFSEAEQSKISSALADLPEELSNASPIPRESDNPINQAGPSPQMRCFSKYHCRDANQNQVCDSIDACATPQTCSGQGRLARYTRVTNENNEDGFCATSSQPEFISYYLFEPSTPDACQQLCTKIKQCSAFEFNNGERQSCAIYGADFDMTPQERSVFNSSVAGTLTLFLYDENNQTITTTVADANITCMVKSFCDDANADSVCDLETSTTPTTNTTNTTNTTANTTATATPPPPPSSSSSLSGGAIAAIVVAGCATAAAAHATYKHIRQRAGTQSAVASHHTYSML